MNILDIIPNTSIEYLFNLTYLDLFELGALCEKITNKKLFTIDSRSVLPKAEKTDGKTFFPDDGKSLQEKMKEMREF
jgi:Mor family transcriptional regulator